MEIFKGKIIKISSEEYSGIIKCRIDGLYNSDTMGNIDDDDLPNLYPMYSPNQNSFYTPKLNDEVFVVLDRGNKYSGLWFAKSKLSQYLLDKLKDDYEGFKSIVIDDEEKLEIYYSRKDGVILKLDKSVINLKNNEITATNENRTLHIKDDMISLGKLNVSDEPCVLGNKNVDALNFISDEAITLANSVFIFCETQKAVTKSIAYLAPLNAAYEPLALKSKLVIDKISNVMKGQRIPETLSKKTSLD
jgi:hypothetical protein